MTTVVGVRFKKAGKIYYFNPDKLNIKLKDNVIVETSRGVEYGSVVIEPREIDKEEIVAPLKDVIRIATGNDDKIYEDNLNKRDSAFKTCQKKIEEHNLEMKLINVEYTFDNKKVMFYFTAEGRVDFRELVKDLASIFRMRIELRQIGIRDEAKLVGGIGPCGKVLCCSSFLSEFHPVSIKMAKDQELSLNPSKISGICGRLMCCLKYEHDTYEEMSKTMPPVGTDVETELGLGVIVSTSLIQEKVKVKVNNQENEEEVMEFKLKDIKVLKRCKKNKN